MSRFWRLLARPASSGRLPALVVMLAAALAAGFTTACGGDGGKSVIPTSPQPPGNSPDTTTPPPVPDSVGSVTTITLTSAALGTTKQVLVYLPPSYSTSGTRRYPVAYFLHGATSNERAWVDSVKLNKVLDSLSKEGVPEMIVVMPDADDSFYHTWVNPPTYQSCLDRGRIDQELATTYCVPQMRYDQYIAADLVAYIDANYRTMASKAHRAVAGYSMGGAGAIYLAYTRPTVFAAAASLSGGVLAILNVGPTDAPVTATDTSQIKSFYGDQWIDFRMRDQYGPDLNVWKQYDPLSIALATPASSSPAIWMVIGSYDGIGLIGNQVFHNALTTHGVTHTYIEVQGEHNFAFWRTHARAAATWVAQQIKP